MPRHGRDWTMIPNRLTHIPAFKEDDYWIAIFQPSFRRKTGWNFSRPPGREIKSSILVRNGFQNFHLVRAAAFEPKFQLPISDYVHPLNWSIGLRIDDPRFDFLGRVSVAAATKRHDQYGNREQQVS